MITKSCALALVRVLLTAAWADSRITQSELNHVKAIARRFHFNDEEWLALQPFFEDPPKDSERDAFLQELLAEIATAGQRDEVLSHLRSLASADNQISAEEHDLIEEYAAALTNTSTASALLGRVRSLFVKKPATGATDLQEFIRNKILFKLRRRVTLEQITPDMYRACLLGGLMGVVARADGEIDQRELELIRHHLDARGTFDRETLDVLMTVIEEEAVRGLDRSRLIAEYAGPLTFEQRVELLDLLFAVAGVNGGLTHAELEELRGVSAALNLSHRQYIDSKLRSRTLHQAG